MSNEVVISSVEEAEDCEYVVCLPISSPLKCPDNLISNCCKCDCLIQHRPNVPRRPPKICWPCVEPDLDREAEKNNLGIMITQKTADEVLEYIRKKTAH